LWSSQFFWERAQFEKLRCVSAWFESAPLEDPVFPLLVRTIRERLEQRLERIFRLTALAYSPQDIYSAYYHCRVKSEMRHGALEFLDNILEGEFKKVIRLAEAIFDPERNRVEQQPIVFVSPDAALEALGKGNDPWLKAIVGEIRARLLSSAEAALPQSNIA
jgi:hypothetical protein